MLELSLALVQTLLHSPWSEIAPVIWHVQVYILFLSDVLQ